MVSKRAIIHTLFVSSFLFFGLGQYITNNFSTPVGNLLSVLPHFLLILFFILDRLYGRKFFVHLSLSIGWVAIFMLSFMYAGILGLSYQVPGYDELKTFTEILKVGLPFIGYLIWAMYHIGEEDFDPAQSLRWALGLYIIVNLIGVGAGVSTLAHSFEDRISFPFSDGIYDGANVLALFVLLLVPLIRQKEGSLQNRAWVFLVLLIASGLIIHINSRLTLLVLLLVSGLFLVRLAHVYGLVFVGSWFFVPFLLNSKMLVYQLLTQPLFASLLKRGDLEDITSYNSRAYIWERAMDWMTYDQTGFWLGNGTRGYGTLRIYEDITDKWMVDVYTLHSHSAMLDIWICQGLLGLALVAGMLFLSLRYYQNKRREKSVFQQFYPILVFLLLLMQVDSFVNPASIGFTLMLMLFALLVVQKRNSLEEEGKNQGRAKQGNAPKGELIVGY